MYWFLCFLKLLETFPKNEHFPVYFDIWFLSVPLLFVLKQNVYLASTTLRVDRTKKCYLLTGKDLRKQRRGSRCYCTDASTGMIINVSN